MRRASDGSKIIDPIYRNVVSSGDIHLLDGSVREVNLISRNNCS